MTAVVAIIVTALSLLILAAVSLLAFLRLGPPSVARAKATSIEAVDRRWFLLP